MWSDADFAAIWPQHWNWPELEGDTKEVRVYSAGDTVVLYLNGEEIGRKAVRPYTRTVFDVPVHEGVLEAIALRNDIEVARDRIETSGPAASLMLRVSQTVIPADRRSVVTLWVSARDDKNRPVRWACNEVFLQVEGDACVLATGSADPYDAAPPKALRRKMYNGSCYMILRAGTRPGQIGIKATAEGLRPACIQIDQAACTRPPHVPVILDVDSLTYFSKMEG